MSQLITGLHHVTALSDGPQRNLDFYAGLLGLRLVKKTINFDAPDVYHLYYGNEQGAPGTIMTFFPFNDIQPGRIGQGQVSVTSFSVPENSVDFWVQRFEKHQVPFQAPQRRFDETVIAFQDPDGLALELVATDRDARPGFSYGPVPLEHAVRGFWGVTLCVAHHERTAALLTEAMHHQPVADTDGRFRYSASGQPGDFVDLFCAPDVARGRGGGGTVHHVAFATPSDDDQRAVREQLVAFGMEPTLVLDRQYFHSIYFREPGGVLFEVATNPPGFAIDETPEHLGEALKLPPWQERNRAEIEQHLTPITLKPDVYA